MDQSTQPHPCRACRGKPNPYGATCTVCHGRGTAPTTREYTIDGTFVEDFLEGYPPFVITITHAPDTCY